MNKQLLNWKNIDIVLLDLDGTLLDLNFDNYFWSYYLPREYSKFFSISEDLANSFIQDSLAEKEGTLDWYDIDYWSDRFNIDLVKMKEKISARVSAKPNVKEFLNTTSKSGKKLILVTNAHRKTLDIKMRQVNLSKWFDAIVVSHDLKAAKESDMFWKKLHSIYHFDIKRTVLIDDNEDVLAAAENHGIANLITIIRPDSQQPKRKNCKFTAINNFSEIMP